MSNNNKPIAGESKNEDMETGQQPKNQASAAADGGTPIKAVGQHDPNAKDQAGSPAKAETKKDTQTDDSKAPKADGSKDPKAEGQIQSGEQETSVGKGPIP
ncbi:MAG: hypothetical protein EOO04_34680, partial [Chitinophagaceae bacterium]